MTPVEKIKVLIYGKDSEFLSELLGLNRSDLEIQRALSTGMVDFLTKEWEPQICVLESAENIESLICFLRTKFSYSELGIIVVARSEEEYQKRESKSFRSGADHFIRYTSEVGSIVVRIESLHKKLLWERPNESELIDFQKTSNLHSLQYGPIAIYPHDFILKISGETVSPTPTQFRLLLTFISHKDQLLTRNWLKNSVWGESEISPRTIDAQISKLKKLVPFLEEHLVNVYGKGYILTEPHQNAA